MDERAAVEEKGREEESSKCVARSINKSTHSECRVATEDKGVVERGE